LTNATVLNGPGAFQENVDRIHSLGIVLPLVEWTFIFLPILFHAIVGLIIIAGGMPNVGAYPYSGNIRYTLQRATGLIAALFILLHVAQLHHLGSWIGIDGLGVFDPHHATSSTARALQPLYVQIGYAVGVLAIVFHFANGLWTQGITWGVWTSEAAMRRAGYVLTVFGVGLAVVGLAALYGMVTADVPQAESIEQRMIEYRHYINDDEVPSAAPLH
jgi:succinate dehydrogenase / fumarate reductase cytochrome b subunit